MTLDSNESKNKEEFNCFEESTGTPFKKKKENTSFQEENANYIYNTAIPTTSKIKKEIIKQYIK